MKHLILILAILLLALPGCERTPQHHRLEVIPASIHASEDGGEFEVEVTGPSDWTTDNTADWISIRKSGSSATVIIKKNTGEERHREIGFLSYPFKDILSIIQDRSGAFAASPLSLNFPYKGGTADISLECYSPWKAECGSEWIALDTTEGNSPATIAVTASQSRDRFARNGTITFKNGERSIDIKVTQAPSPYIEVEKSDVETDGDGGQMQILYISNTDVTITTEEQWIRLIETGSEEKVLAFEIMRNLGDRRTGSIRITSVSDSDYYNTVTVIQGEKIDHPSLSFEEGVYLEISRKGTFMLHPVFVDMTDTGLEWGSSNPSVASVGQDGLITVNTGGTCTITATNRHHGLTASISLNIRITAEDMTLFLDSQDMHQNPMAVRFPGESLTIRAAFTPEDAYTGDLVCISSFPDIVHIDGMKIRCISPGKTTITVESLYHGLTKSFELVILED